MAVKTVEKEISGHIVTFTPMGFLESLKIKRGILAPIIKGMTKTVGSDFQDLSGVEDILMYLDESKIVELTKTIMNYCTIDGQDMSLGANLDEYFSANTTLFYKVVAYWAEVNYGDFLGLIRGGLGKIGPMMDKLTQGMTGSSATTMKDLLKN